VNSAERRIVAWRAEDIFGLRARVPTYWDWMRLRMAAKGKLLKINWLGSGRQSANIG
jgi:hypothetical protein